MRRLLSIFFPLLAVLVMALPTEAALIWCKRDPVVSLNGTVLRILVAVPEEYAPYVNGPIKVEIEAPQSVDKHLLAVDAGFNGHGEKVKFENEGTASGRFMPTEIEVKVPMDRSEVDPEEVPMQMTIIPDNAPTMIFEGEASELEVDLTVTGRWSSAAAATGGW